MGAARIWIHADCTPMESTEWNGMKVVHCGQMWWIGYISSSGVRYAWNECVHVGILIFVNLVSVDCMQTVSCGGCGAVLYQSI